MKKLILGIAIFGFTSTIIAQEAADKKVQAGIITGFGMNFQKMGTKLMSNDGAGTDLTIGANAVFSLNETIGLCTGLEFDFESLKYMNGPSSNVYYYYRDNEIIAKDDVSSTTNAQLYQLTTRKQKPVYLTIPTMLVFRTNYIGYLRYFGKFGLRNSFLLKNEIYDNGYNFDPEEVLTGVPSAGANDNMCATGEMWFFKSAVGLVGGAEWNFSGSTCLVGEIGYYYGFTPLHYDKKEDNSYLFTTDKNNGSGNDQYFSNQATQSQLMLKVSILF